MLLEDGQLGAFVDTALIDGVGHGEVDDPAEEDAVAHLGVEVAAIVAEGHYVLEAALVGQEAGVDPVGYGSLLLLRHHVVPVPMLGLLLDRLLMVTVWFVIYSNTLERKANWVNQNYLPNFGGCLPSSPACCRRASLCGISP